MMDFRGDNLDTKFTVRRNGGKECIAPAHCAAIYCSLSIGNGRTKLVP